MDQHQLEEQVEQFAIELSAKMCAAGCDLTSAKKAGSVILSVRQIIRESFEQNPTPRSRSGSTVSPRELQMVTSILEFTESKKSEEHELRSHEPIPKRLFEVYESAEIPAPEE